MRNFSLGESTGIAVTYVGGLFAFAYCREDILKPLLSGNVWADGLAVSAAINGVGFLCGLKSQSFRHFDATGAVANLATVLTAMVNNPASAPVTAIASIAAGWASRLGGFLTWRAAQHGDDVRLAKMKPPGKMLAVWVLQIIWGYMTVLPVLVAAAGTTDGDASPLANPMAAAGCALAAAGLGIETLADHQKTVAKAMHPDKFVQTGLWRYSRFANYFGEILLWTGLATATVAYTKDHAESAVALSAAAAASPAFVYFLLRYVSGIPPLLRSQEEKYGALKQYQEYKKNTSLLFPGL